MRSEKKVLFVLCSVISLLSLFSFFFPQVLPGSGHRHDTQTNQGFSGQFYLTWSELGEELLSTKEAKC